MKRSLNLVLVLLLLVSLITACSKPAPTPAPQAGGSNSTPEEKKVTLKMAHVGAPGSPQQAIAELFAKKVADKTKGTVTIEIHHSGTLGKEKELQEGVRSGTVDMTIAGTFSYAIKWAGILETPMLYQDMDHFIRVFSGQVGDDLMAEYEKALGTKSLFIAPHGGFRYITTKDTAVTKPSDLKDLKLRNPNVPAFNIMAKAVEAIPVPLDFSELYTALDRGVVQGQHNPVGNIYGSKLYEVQGYLSMVPWGISPHVVSASKTAWNKLSPTQQKLVMEAAKETGKEYPAVALKEEATQMETIAAKLKVIKPSEIDLAAFSKVFEEKGMPELEKEYGADGMKWVKAILGAKK